MPKPRPSNNDRSRRPSFNGKGKDLGDRPRPSRGSPSRSSGPSRSEGTSRSFGPSRPSRPSRTSGGPSSRPRPTGGPAKPFTRSTPAKSTAQGERLQRVLADAGIASRRECEQMIVDGRVEVNGEIVTKLPIFVNPHSDRIRVDGRFLSKEDTSAHRVYVMLNKPDNTLGTTKDDLEYKKGGRRTVADLVKHQTGARLFPVGRLDFHSTGLVLMTNDGDLAERLTHAKYGMTKTYRVWIHGGVPTEILDMLRRRVGKREAPQGGVRIISDDDAHQISRQRRPQAPGNMTVLEIESREGRTEPLDEMLVTAGCRLKRIARIAIGTLRLTGVTPGDWRDLTKDEVRTLKEAAGLYKPPTPPRLTHGGGPVPDRRKGPETPMNPPSHPSPAESEVDSPEDDG